jgi:preprotein translocase subunit SecF
MNIRFSKYLYLYYIFSGILIAASITSFIVFGLKFGIEFTGGSEMELQFSDNRPSSEEIREKLAEFNLGDFSIQPVGDNELILKSKEIDNVINQQIVSKLKETMEFEEKSFEFIGPVIGNELKQKTEIAIILSLLAITLYIAFAFRKVSFPVSSWQYGIASLIALFHDILIPLGVFSILGHFYDVEITIPVIAALLTILGFSVHDTIVIFDRIRENIFKRGVNQFEDTVNSSLNQTLGRSISTVLTVLIVLFAIYFFGGQALKYFSLALIIGITCGAYSSIFIASSLLVSWYRWKENKFQITGHKK